MAKGETPDLEIPREPCRLYLVTPPSIDLNVFAEDFKRAADGGDIASFQLRLKVGDTSASDDEVRRATETLMPIAYEHDIAFLLNDRPDLAKEMGCDGAHIGQSDMGYKKARQVLGDDAIIGVTCNASQHLAMEAGEQGADYVAFGAFYATKTKEATGNASPDILAWWSEIFEIPCVAIGGITTENAPVLIEAGADFLAVSGGVWSHKDGPAEAVATFNKCFAP
jgi:thiamine-phosphate pyrophosphorylase